MNSYTEKWNRFPNDTRLPDERFYGDVFKHFKTPYFTTIKPTDNKKSSYRDNDQNSSGKFHHDKHYNHHNYRKHKKDRHDDTKDHDSNNKFSKRLVGYSKYNQFKDAVEAQRGEEINNNPIIRSNLEKKQAVNNQTENVCDNKSINSLETQNTINEEEIEETSPQKRTRQYDVTTSKDANKINSINTLKIDFNKEKGDDVTSKADDSFFRKHLSDNDGFPSNKFSQPVFGNAYEFSRGTAPFGNYMFNPFPMMENYPMMPQFGFGTFLPGMYNYFPNNGMFNNAQPPSTHSNYVPKTKSNQKGYMEEFTQLKEDCERLNSQQSFSTNNSIDALSRSDSEHALESNNETIHNNVASLSKEQTHIHPTNLPQQNKTTQRGGNILSINVKFTETETKTLNIRSDVDAFTSVKEFCCENGLGQEIFYSLYTKVNVALTAMLTIHKDKDLNTVVGSAANVFSKVKRSHSAHELRARERI